MAVATMVEFVCHLKCASARMDTPVQNVNYLFARKVVSMVVDVLGLTIVLVEVAILGTLVKLLFASLIARMVVLVFNRMCVHVLRGVTEDSAKNFLAPHHAEMVEDVLVQTPALVTVVTQEDTAKQRLVREAVKMVDSA